MRISYWSSDVCSSDLLLVNTKGQIYHYYRSKLDLYFDVAVGALYMINESFGEPVEGDGTRAINWLRQAVHAISREIMQNYPFHRVALEATQFQLIGDRKSTRLNSSH